MDKASGALPKKLRTRKLIFYDRTKKFYRKKCPEKNEIHFSI